MVPKADEDTRLATLRDWLTRLGEAIDADLSVRLWNGEVVPLGRTVTSDLVLAINTPDAVRRGILEPRLMTLVELNVEGLIEIEGGTPLDLVRAADYMRANRHLRSISKVELAKALWPFVSRRVESDATVAGTSYMKRVRALFGKGRDDADMVQHHYDVSNEFYRLLLGPEMVYSPGYYADRETDLATAEREKLATVCRKLRLKPGHRLLDIGCGWGSLAITAARDFGAIVHGVTLSKEQFALACERVREAGLEDRITLELKDYRDIPAEGQFDAVCQVGMSEHLGLDNHDAFFQRVHDLLKPRGMYFHEAAQRPGLRDLKKYRTPTAFRDIITRFIFPGGELDFLGFATTGMEAHRLEVHDVENIREHYQRSLELWTQNLYENREAAGEAAGWPRVRLWLLYLSLFAVGFDRGVCTCFQIVASRRHTGPGPLPMARG